jgi:glutamine cyclotransferase
MFDSPRKRLWFSLAGVVAVIVALAAWAQFGMARSARFLEARVVAAYPHDPQAFTQGLAFHGGELYEGTGLYGESSIRQVDYATGLVEKKRPLNRIYFGEGIAILGEKLFQLTWQNQIAVVYDLETFEILGTHLYEGEGWGLTHDGRSLILSDGTANIKYIDPTDFSVLRTIEVHDGDTPVERLNELEYIDGEIWANIWYEDRIARISPESGEVKGWIDIGGLYPQSRRGREDVANGIAFDADSKRLFVTGKNWPQLFEIELVRPGDR